MLLYYITDGTQLPGKALDRGRLLDKIAEAARSGVDYVQLREKDLSGRELEALAYEAVECVKRIRRETNSPTKLLVNSRVDIALASGADGVHLTSNNIAPSEARSIAAKSQMRRGDFVVSVSCHSVEDALLAESQGADFIVLGPIFGKIATGAAGIGSSVFRELALPKEAGRGIEAGEARDRMPVLALGGITLENAEQCRRAGAAGIAGIRIFQDNNIQRVVAALATL